MKALRVVISKWKMYSGDVVSFNYNGGSTPGATRRVYVKSVDGVLAYCWDFDTQDVRNFKIDNITNVHFIENVKIVDITELPKSVTASNIASAFKRDDYKTYCTSTSIIAIKNKPTNQVVVNVFKRGDDEYSVFINVDKKCVGFFITNDSLIIQGDGSTAYITNPTADDLKKVLATLEL